MKIAFIFVALIALRLVEATSARAGTNSNSYSNSNSNSSPPNKFTQLMNVDDTVLLMLDHQTGLLQTVHDQSARDARALAGVLIKAASLRGIPIFTTASEPTGPNGPIWPELAQYAPNSTYIPRQGEISAWDNPNFAAAVRRTGRKTLIIAGIWTSVCVTFPALQTVAEGYKVYAVTDASGDPTPFVSMTTHFRLAQAGVIVTSTNAVIAEFQRTWRRPDAAQYAALYAEAVPNYQLLIESANNGN